VKTAAERSIEALTWAAVVIWLGFALVAHILNYVWLVVMMLGIILLSSAIYQRSRGWHTSLSLWIFGIWMAVFSVLETVSSLVGAITGGNGLGIDLWVYLGIALVSMGVAVVFRTVQGPRLAVSPRTPSQRQDTTGYTRDRSQYAAPRRATDDSSSGYIPSPQEQAQYGDYGVPPAGDSQYTQPSQRARRYQEQPLPGDYQYSQPPQPDDNQYTQPSQRAPRYQEQPLPGDYQYTQPSQRAPRYEPPPQDPGRSAAPQSRARTPQRSPRRSRPAPEPNDLESRVDDIIRRSRERRGGDTGSSGGGDDLPY
jgi:hypothetical protein